MNMYYIRKNNCEAMALDDHLMVVNPDNFTVTDLNESGGKCWALLEKRQSADTLMKKLLSSEDHAADGQQEDLARLRTDVEAFLMQMTAYGLIEHVG